MDKLKQALVDLGEDDVILEIIEEFKLVKKEINEVLENIPPPEKGETGDKGEKGDKGDKGDRGDRGGVGPRGFKGERGEKGTDGKDGEDGKDGKSVKLEQVLDELRPEVASRLLRSIPEGKSMNRNISIGGNSSVLSKYTDINLKAGANVALTYANNPTTHNVDVTISATGGGGGGISRSINSISTSQPAGSTPATDYVYLCTGTLTLTMPDATAGNTNLYTVKNVGTGVVTVNTTSAQTIDGSPTAILPLQYTSIDLESDTANWNIT